MKRSLALLVSTMLVLTLILPGAVLAAGKGNAGTTSGKGQAGRVTSTPPGVAEDPALNGHKAAVQEKKAAKVEAKNARMAAKGITQGPKASRESSPTSPVVNPSVEGTKSVGPGVANALQHIITNLTRKFAKFGEALPQGLVNVWYKFSTWLGISTDTRPWEPAPEAPVLDENPPSEVETEAPVPLTLSPPIDIPLPD